MAILQKLKATFIINAVPYQSGEFRHRGYDWYEIDCINNAGQVARIVKLHRNNLQRAGRFEITTPSEVYLMRIHAVEW